MYLNIEETNVELEKKFGIGAFVLGYGQAKLPLWNYRVFEVNLL